MKYLVTWKLYSDSDICHIEFDNLNQVCGAIDAIREIKGILISVCQI